MAHMSYPDCIFCGSVMDPRIPYMGNMGAKAFSRLGSVKQEERVCPSCGAYADVFMAGPTQGILIMYKDADYIRALGAVFVWVADVLIPTLNNQKTLEVSDVEAPPVGFSYFETTPAGWSQITAWGS